MARARWSSSGDGVAGVGRGGRGVGAGQGAPEVEGRRGERDGRPGGGGGHGAVEPAVGDEPEAGRGRGGREEEGGGVGGGVGGVRAGQHLAEDVGGEQGGGGGVGRGDGVGPAGAHPQEVGGFAHAGPVEDEDGVAAGGVAEAEEVGHAAVAGHGLVAEDGDAGAGFGPFEEGPGDGVQKGRGAGVGDGAVPDVDGREDGGEQEGEGGMEPAVEAGRPFGVGHLGLAVDPEFAGDGAGGQGEGGVGEQREEEGPGDGPGKPEFGEQPSDGENGQYGAEEHLVLAIVPRGAAGAEEDDHQREPGRGEGGEEAGMAVGEEHGRAVRQDAEEGRGQGGGRAVGRGGGKAGTDEVEGDQDVGAGAEEEAGEPEEPGAGTAGAALLEEDHAHRNEDGREEGPEHGVLEGAGGEAEAQGEEPAVAGGLGRAGEQPQGNAAEEDVEGVREGPRGGERPGGARQEEEARGGRGDEAGLPLPDQVGGDGPGDGVVGDAQHEGDEDRDGEGAAEGGERVHRRRDGESGAGGQAHEGFPDGGGGYAGAVQAQGLDQCVRGLPGAGGRAEQRAEEQQGEEKEKGREEAGKAEEEGGGRGRRRGDAAGSRVPGRGRGSRAGGAPALRLVPEGGHSAARRRSWRRACSAGANSWMRPRSSSRSSRAAPVWLRAR